VLKWLIYGSAAGFWVGLAALVAFKRSMDRTFEDIKIELEAERQIDGWDPDDWGWVVDLDDEGNGLPLYVPDDMAQRAVDVLNAETVEQLRDLKAEQWRWTINAMSMRQAMHIAQQEPNLEIALWTWVAQQTLPNEIT